MYLFQKLIKEQKCFVYIFLIFNLISCKNSSENSVALPGICISFDDRAVKEWYEINPLLKEYKANVTFFVTLFHSLPQEEIEMLKALEKDGHEIGSHGAGHAASEFYIKEHSYQDYIKTQIDGSINSMKEKGFTPTSFSYPYGSKYWFTDYLLLKKFKVLRGVSPLNKEKDLTLIKDIYFDFDNDKTVDAIGIDNGSGVTKEMIKKAIVHAAKTKQVLLVYAHVPSETVDITFLRFVLDEAQKNGLKFYRMSDLAM